MNSNTEFNAINELDLDPIKANLMDQESGEGWSLDQASTVEFEYRRFLCLMKLFPNEDVAPLVDVDTFWHYHILDTMKYAADCEQIFGYFLHHVPSGTQRGGDAEAVHDRSGARMQELYEATFGDRYTRQGDGNAITEGSQLAGAQIAWCAPTAPKAAWCAPTAPKAAWCAPTTPKAAWCAPTRPKAAWCAPTAPKSAWCAPTAPGAALQGAKAISVRSQTVVQNDSFYSQQMEALAA